MAILWACAYLTRLIQSIIQQKSTFGLMKLTRQPKKRQSKLTAKRTPRLVKSLMPLYLYLTRMRYGTISVDQYTACRIYKMQPSSFNTVKEWAPFLDQAEPGIRLCIGTSSNQPLDMEVDAEINDWCLSNSFDYVDMDEKTDIPMDKVRIDLALEIIQTNFWDGMVKKNASGIAEDEDLLNEIRELKLAQDRDILKLGDEDDQDIEDMPTQHEIDKMRSELFGDIDGEDGLDKAFEAIQAMRGNIGDRVASSLGIDHAIDRTRQKSL